MMNAGIFLVLAVHEIAIAAELAIATRATEKANTHPLTDRPALNTGTKGIDSPDDFMARDARPTNRGRFLPPCRIRMADPAGLDANANVAGPGPDKWAFYFRELSRPRDFDCFVCSVSYFLL